MAASALTRFGNDLYTGERSVPFIGRRRIWLTIAVVLVVLASLVPFARGGGNWLAGFNFGIEFRGGSQFQVSEAATVDTDLAEQVVHGVVPDAVVHVTTAGDAGLRIKTDQLTNDQTQEIAVALEAAFETDAVTFSFVGATWGADITRQGLLGLGVFLLIAAVLMAFYFRTWKMSLAAMIALIHDLVITIGVYGATGFEITPAAVIGFLTILGFSLYDTVVVFDKIRENTTENSAASAQDFASTVNLAVNQTLVRSINTGIVAALPTAAILFLGSFVLGADTLRDISLALLVGTVIGTYSTPFVAAPIYSWLREDEFEPRPANAPFNVLAVLSLCFSLVGGVIGIVLGHVALIQIRTSRERGRDLALAGLLIGYGALALSVLAGAIILGAVAAAIS